MKADGFKSKPILCGIVAATLLGISHATTAEETGYWTYGPAFGAWANGRYKHEQYLRAEHEKAMEAMKHVKKEPRYWTYGPAFAAWANGRPNHDEYMRAEHERVMATLKQSTGTDGEAELAAFEGIDESAVTIGFRPWDTAQ